MLGTRNNLRKGLLLFHDFNLVLSVGGHGELCIVASVTEVDDDELVVAGRQLLLVNYTVAGAHRHRLLIHYLTMHVSEKQIEFFSGLFLTVWRCCTLCIGVHGQEDLHWTNQIEWKDPLAASIGHARGARLPCVVVVGDVVVGERLIELSSRHEECVGLERL